MRSSVFVLGVGLGKWFCCQHLFPRAAWVALTWLRSIGETVFLFAGVLPLVWFILSRGRQLVREVELDEGEWTVYDKEWASHEEELARVVKGVK